AEFDDDVSQRELRQEKDDPDDDQGAHELRIVDDSMSADRGRKPPRFGGEIITNNGGQSPNDGSEQHPEFPPRHFPYSLIRKVDATYHTGRRTCKSESAGGGILFNAEARRREETRRKQDRNGAPPH